MKEGAAGSELFTETLGWVWPDQVPRKVRGNRIYCGQQLKDQRFPNGDSFHGSCAKACLRGPQRDHTNFVTEVNVTEAEIKQFPCAQEAMKPQRKEQGISNTLMFDCMSDKGPGKLTSERCSPNWWFNSAPAFEVSPSFFNPAFDLRPEEMETGQSVCDVIKWGAFDPLNFNPIAKDFIQRKEIIEVLKHWEDTRYRLFVPKTGLFGNSEIFEANALSAPLTLLSRMRRQHNPRGVPGHHFLEAASVGFSADPTWEFNKTEPMASWTAPIWLQRGCRSWELVLPLLKINRQTMESSRCSHLELTWRGSRQRQSIDSRIIFISR